jgi:predicted metal-binding membrane protein
VGGVGEARFFPSAQERAMRGGVADAVAAMRTRLGLVALLFGVTGLAWWSTVHRMAGMDAGPGTDLGTLGWFVGVWVVMMAAMMFPSVAPTVALYARMTRRGGLDRSLLFTGAYLVVWAVAGVAAYGVFRLGKVTFGAELAWGNGGRWVAGGVLGVAAIYELTPLKYACLEKCRSPLGFLIGAWREGPRGALEMGARHAVWCVGCCWALMAALFALGVMSLVWMALVGIMITLEKTLPWRGVATWAAAAILLTLAIMIVAAPAAIPGLVVPNSATGVHAMATMR